MLSFFKLSDMTRGIAQVNHKNQYYMMLYYIYRKRVALFFFYFEPDKMTLLCLTESKNRIQDNLRIVMFKSLNKKKEI